MNQVEAEQLKMEIAHIFESGANEIRIFEMVKSFIESRYQGKDNSVLPYVSNSEARVSVCDHVWIMSADSFDQTCYCKKCGKSD